MQYAQGRALSPLQQNSLLIEVCLLKQLLCVTAVVGQLRNIFGLPNEVRLRLAAIVYASRRCRADALAGRADAMQTLAFENNVAGPSRFYDLGFRREVYRR